ncbi:MAG: hypothetical protein AAGF93_01415 [Cyanobacteria bacterium P01_H01_bin.105]
MSYTFVGITIGDLKNQVCIGVVNFSNNTAYSESFLLTPVSFDEINQMYQEKFFSSDLLCIGKFLLFNIPNPHETQVIAEIPSGFLNGNSVLVKLFIFLASLGYCDGLDIFPLKKEDFLLTFKDYSKCLDPKLEKENDWIVLLPHKYYYVLDSSGNLVRGVTSDDKPLVERQHKRGFIYLNPDMARAYGNFLLGKSVSAESTALVLGLIATNSSLYYFLNSHGLVLSLEDVVTTMAQYPEMRQTYKQLETYSCSALSSEESSMITVTQNTLVENIDSVALWYKIQVKKHKFLEKKDAIKFALLHICKRFMLELSCISVSDNHYSYPNNFLKENSEFRTAWKDLNTESRKSDFSENDIYVPGEELKPWILDMFK